MSDFRSVPNASLPTPHPFFLPGNPFQLAAAAAAAGLPVSLPGASNSPFFRPPVAQNVMDQMSQTQQALLNMMRSAQTQKDLKRKSESNALDLSPRENSKRSKSSEISLCNLVSPCSHEAKEVKSWTVEDVCQFVASVELCSPFVEVIRLQNYILAAVCHCL